MCTAHSTLRHYLFTSRNLHQAWQHESCCVALLFGMVACLMPYDSARHMTYDSLLRACVCIRLDSCCLVHTSVSSGLSRQHRDEQTGKPRTISTLLRTTGGDCSQSVGRSMAQLFAGAGSPSLFYWDKGMWQLSKPPAGTPAIVLLQILPAQIPNEQLCISVHGVGFA